MSPLHRRPREEVMTSRTGGARRLGERIAASAAAALLLATRSPVVDAQTSIESAAGSVSQGAVSGAPTMCSCSPTSFTFMLQLSGNCEINEIGDNPGIDGSFCFVEEGVALPAPPPPPPCSFCPQGLKNPMFVLPTQDRATCQQAADLAAGLATTDLMCGTVKLAESLCCDPVLKDLMDVEIVTVTNPGNVRHLLHGRRLQAAVPASKQVVEVVSVQFLEFDTSGDLTVINQDDTYADVSLKDGARMKFDSASSFLDTSKLLAAQTTSPALVPGGASLILYGKTATGEVVRNRFFWMYDMNCGRENNPVQVGDEIGWVMVTETSGAWPTFCPALPAGSPTIPPRTNQPTITPSASPIKSPTTSPTPLPTVRASLVPGWGGSVTPIRPGVHPGAGGKGKGKGGAFFAGAKSHKPKTPKWGKSAKSAKSAKGHKSAKGSYDDGHYVQGKTHKTHKDPWWGGSGKYGMGRESVFDAERANGGEARRSAFAVVSSLVACAILLARQ